MTAGTGLSARKLSRGAFVRRLIAIGCLTVVFPSGLVAQSSRGLSVYVIAPSVSTSMEAREIRLKNGWSEGRVRQADAILVVVRSGLFNPLEFSYKSVSELERDADNQLNIAGENFHVYIYSLDDDLKVTQVKHTSYKAD